MTRKTETKTEAKRESVPPRFHAFHVVERGDNAYWTRIGAAWNHEDGEGLTLQLDLFPVSGGRIVLRTPKAKEPDED